MPSPTLEKVNVAVRLSKPGNKKLVFEVKQSRGAMYGKQIMTSSEAISFAKNILQTVERTK